MDLDVWGREGDRVRTVRVRRAGVGGTVLCNQGDRTVELRDEEDVSFSYPAFSQAWRRSDRGVQVRRRNLQNLGHQYLPSLR